MNPADPNHGVVVGSAEDQVLTFFLDGEEYGMDILRVKEIKGWTGVTPLPNTPDHLLGVLNLRGDVVPVVDLRLRFGMDSLEYGPTTVVVVIRIEDGERSCHVGVVVDAVSDVHDVPQETIKPVQGVGLSEDELLVRGMATVEEKMIIMLDVDHLFAEDAQLARTA